MNQFLFDRVALGFQRNSILPPTLWGNKPTVLSAIVWLLPLGLWGAIWLSIHSGDIDLLFKPTSFYDFKEGLRAAFPIMAAIWALVTILAHLYLRRPPRTFYLSPLWLLTIYGVVGFASAALSLDGSVSLYWAGVYISVPLVLLALVWGEDGPHRLHLLMNITWFIFLLTTIILFILAITKLNLANSILNPIDLFECKPIGHWFTFTGGVLRSTGVGRYAAIAAIIALSFIWSSGGWKTSGLKKYSLIPWTIMFVGALTLLLSTGARTSIIAFAGAAVIVFLLSGGKKSIFVGGLAVAIFLPLGWGTGFHSGFFKSCLFHDFSVTNGGIVSRSGEVSSLTPPGLPATPTSSATESPATPIKPAPGIPAAPGTPDLSTAASQATPETPDPSTAASQATPETPGPSTAASQATPEAPGPSTAASQATPGQATSRAKDDSANISMLVSPGRVNSEPALKGPYNIAGLISIPRGFFSFSGRSGIWEAAIDTVTDSPLLGHGFQSDRLLLGTHVHNAFLQSLIQTGILGATAFLAGITLGWVLMIKAIKNLARYPAETRHKIILSAGLLFFLSIRAIPESTGAFFGVDWLILAPILLQIEVLSRSNTPTDNAVLESDNRKLSPGLNWGINSS